MQSESNMKAGCKLGGLFLLMFIIPVLALGMKLCINLSVGLKYIDGAAGKLQTAADQRMFGLADAMPAIGLEASSCSSSSS